MANLMLVQPVTVTVCTIRFNVQNFCILCAEGLYMSCTDRKTNSFNSLKAHCVLFKCDMNMFIYNPYYL